MGGARTAHTTIVPGAPVHPCSMPSSATFGALTGLTTLRLSNTPEGLDPGHWRAAVAAALRRVPQLRLLQLVYIEEPDELLLAALANLGQLRAFSCTMPCACRQGLPANGPWLASLRRLALPAEAALASQRMLAACSRLEWLGIAGEWPGALVLTPQNLALVQRCVDFPSMRHIMLSCCASEEAAGWREPLVALQLIRPHLSIWTVCDPTELYRLPDE